ncbi:GerA spore germination protein [Paenibacillus sp. UNC496MF]|uniref:spore germination protein n=1 Tax=Paenibacillus sp. UNC496MF TaxID=1502753 RepID=UPI0008E10330|nr:spore germination protein [Paenibacillus sp. UNC496MF]SFI49866.1 GerA spore germination protein [Paenibacillus sp. UNC496MF]
MTQTQTHTEALDALLAAARRSSDFASGTLPFADPPIAIAYFKTLIDDELLREHLLEALQTRLPAPCRSLEEIARALPIDGIELTDDVGAIQHKLFKGHVLLRLDERDPRCALVPLVSRKGIRQSNITESEFSVVGTNVGFIEDLETNLRLIRSQLNVPNLVVKEVSVGSVSRSRVAVLYLDGAANEDHVAHMLHRLNAVDFDVLFDTSQLDQILSDNSMSPFPLFTTTERRDRAVFALLMGQVAVASEGSAYFLLGPSTLFDFFLSTEDYLLPWVLASFFRIIRVLGVIYSVFASAMYVAIATFHYEVVPSGLLGPLINSRNNIPFPPVMEVLFLEITVELLREAGARLPKRIGQTIGVVGGVILGQAAVEAALTSNILIIIVSLSALASFVTPIYKMSNAIRFIRFPIIMLAAVWGGLGILMGCGFLLVHLTRLRSLGSPYTAPFYPLRFKDWNDSLVRSSYQRLNGRPGYLRPQTQIRYKPKPVKRENRLDKE